MFVKRLTDCLLEFRRILITEILLIILPVFWFF